MDANAIVEFEDEDFLKLKTVLEAKIDKSIDFAIAEIKQHVEAHVRLAVSTMQDRCIAAIQDVSNIVTERMSQLDVQVTGMQKGIGKIFSSLNANDAKIEAMDAKIGNVPAAVVPDPEQKKAISFDNLTQTIKKGYYEIINETYSKLCADQNFQFQEHVPKSRPAMKFMKDVCDQVEHVYDFGQVDSQMYVIIESNCQICIH